MNHTRLMTNNHNTYLVDRHKTRLRHPTTEIQGMEAGSSLEFRYDSIHFWGARIEGSHLYLADRNGRSVLSEDLVNNHLWSPSYEC